MHHWTFICELCGGTYISQYEGEFVSDAIDAWTRRELSDVLKLASNDTPRKYEVDIDKSDATPLAGLRQTFFWTFSLNYKKFWLLSDVKLGSVNIVKTKV